MIINFISCKIFIFFINSQQYSFLSVIFSLDDHKFCRLNGLPEISAIVSCVVVLYRDVEINGNLRFLFHFDHKIKWCGIFFFFRQFWMSLYWFLSGICFWWLVISITGSLSLNWTLWALNLSWFSGNIGFSSRSVWIWWHSQNWIESVNWLDSTGCFSWVSTLPLFNYLPH